MSIAISISHPELSRQQQEITGIYTCFLPRVTRSPVDRLKMIASSLHVILFLSVISTLLRPSKTCSCMNLPSASEYFCNSPFVAILRVEGDAESCGFFSKCYPFSLIRALKIDAPKGRKNFHINMTYLKTPEDEGMCGVTLTPGTEYMVTGALSDTGEPSIYSCGLVENWADLHADRKDEVYQLFDPRLYCGEREGEAPK